MGILLNYIRNIGYFLILMSLVSNVMPDNSYKKYCRMFCGLILVVLVINPFYEFLNYNGELKDIFVDANYKSQVAELKSQLLIKEEGAVNRFKLEYEKLLANQLQGIAKEEGLYISKVEVELMEEEELNIKQLNIYVTDDLTEIENEKNMEDTYNISIDKISVGDNKDSVTDDILDKNINSSDNFNPRALVLIRRAGEFLKLDTSIINIIFV
ncbi:MAG: stage III sporulation protein AF [Lachnospiraceae bacterium]|nr:stage III sporulation protein AF [Lachnospiraceae bacterium]